MKKCQVCHKIHLSDLAPFKKETKQDFHEDDQSLQTNCVSFGTSLTGRTLFALRPSWKAPILLVGKEVWKKVWIWIDPEKFTWKPRMELEVWLR